LGDVAKIFPYRDTAGRLMGRAKLAGADDGVSMFYPFRNTTGQLMFRGANAEGEVVKGFPYRTSSSDLMEVRTIGCDATTCEEWNCPFADKYVVTLTGWGTLGGHNVNGSWVVDEQGLFTRGLGSCHWSYPLGYPIPYPRILLTRTQPAWPVAGYANAWLVDVYGSLFAYSIRKASMEGKPRCEPPIGLNYDVLLAGVFGGTIEVSEYNP